MCFFTKSPLKVAKEDIICYKYASRRGIFHFTSYYNCFIYLKGKKQPKVNLIERGYHNIEEGYHSYINLYSPDAMMNTKWGKFIIPKGALYFENEYQYVSNQIIYASPIWKRMPRISRELE